MGNKSREDSGLANSEGSGAADRTQSHSALDPEYEEVMEMLLAACLAMPRPRLESAIDEACTKHPHLAPHLRHRYVNLLQMGILEQHEKEEGLKEEDLSEESAG